MDADRCPRCGAWMLVVPGSDRTTRAGTWYVLRCPKCCHVVWDAFKPKKSNGK